MFRLAAVVLLVGASAMLAAQVEPEIVRTWSVRWVDVSDRLGNHRTEPMLAWANGQQAKPGVKYAAPPQLSLVASLDEQLRAARLSNDAATLARILSDDFVETTRDGDIHGKADSIALSRTGRILSLVTNRATGTASSTAVILTGDQTEVNPSGTLRLVFTRVYVQEPTRDWKLLTSTQFRKP